MAVAHYRYYLYGNKVTALIDHAALKVILGVSNLNGNQAPWWSKEHGSKIRVAIVHQAG